MIDPKHLQLVLAIDKYGSLNKASKALHLTQSALSHQLKNLEEYLGIQIFHRVGNQLYFTEAGKEIREKGAVILKELNALESRMIEWREKQLQRYIHGYTQKEARRLVDQATSIEEYLHVDSIWEKDARILEVGCGVGAQTQIIAAKNPDAHFTSIDISEASIKLARKKIKALGLTNVTFRVEDIRELSRKKGVRFDHVFLCFILEHLPDPAEVLAALRHIIRPQGTITVIEGDHGSTFFHPDNAYAKKVVSAQVALQEKRGGNANIGRTLYPLLNQAGYQQIQVSPRQIYVDQSKPILVEGFIKNTFTAMMTGMSADLISEGLVAKTEYELGINGLLRTAEADGVFSYTFFKGKALR